MGECEHDVAEGCGYSEGPLMACLESLLRLSAALKEERLLGFNPDLIAIEFLDYHSRLDAFLRDS